MKTGKITAKLRDAVPVCLMVEGKEVKRYKNIDLPDTLKEAEMLDFHFNVPADGKITFEINYAPGVLPEVFPEARAKMTRAEKAAAKEAAKATAEQEPTPEENTTTATETPDAIPEQKEAALAIIPEAPATEPEKAEYTATENEAAEESTIEANKPAEEPGTMEILYNVTGPRRKELAAAVGSFIGAEPKYMKAPTYAFAVEDYTISKDGTLTGRENKALVEALAAQGFTAA